MDYAGPDRSRSAGARRRTQRPTVADVAREAGVSAMTVSRVINKDVRVLPETRDKVHAAVAALGYVPNMAARSLAGAQRCRLALVYSNPSAGYLSELLLGSLEQARKSDVELLVESFDGPGFMKKLLSHRLEGVILPPPLCDDQPLLQALLDAGIHVVQIATGSPDARAWAISIDDEAAAHAMTAHVLDLGHRRIGFITGDPNQTASALRLAGYQRALREASIAPDPDLVMDGNFSFQSGLVATERLLSRSVRPTAIFASNDDMAAAAVSITHRQGLSVPGDIAICGFDDTAIARTLWPELTTIRQPVAAMAGAAVRMLVDAVRSRRTGAESPPMHDRLSFELVERGSTANPELHS